MKKQMSLIPILILAAGAAAFVAGCAGAEKLSASSSLPAAEGTLLCDKAANDNTSIDLKVKHLANPDRLTPPAAVYVVWMKTDKDATPQNLGALKVDEDLNGRLTTVTSQRRFEVFITGEATGQGISPSGAPLLWANCNR